MKLLLLTGHDRSSASTEMPPVRKRAASALCLLAIAIALSACGKGDDGLQTASPVGLDPASPSPVVTPLTSANGHAKYSWIKANIFDSKCMDCHSAHQGDGDGLEKANFDSYEDVLKTITPMHPYKSDLYIMVQSKKMPKGMDAMPGMPAKPGVPLNKTELQAISDWITSGAPNN